MPKNIINTTCYIMLWALSTPIFASTTNIQHKIDQLTKKYNLDNNIGILAISPNHHQVIYQKNPHKLLVPASSLKIIPAVAALSFLGTDYQFKTQILAKNNLVTNGTINSDLFLHFSGDPSLTRQNINDLIHQLSILGITKINGNFYIDDSEFDEHYLGRGWKQEDLAYCYSAPIGAIMVDRNCLSLKINPSNIGKKAMIADKQPVSIFNEIYSKSPKSRGNCVIKLGSSDNNDYYLSGCVKSNNSPVYISTTIRNPRLFAKNILATQLANESITITGAIDYKSAEASTAQVTLAEHLSEPLTELIKPILKKSNNTVADALYKKLGAVLFKKTASWDDGFKAIKSIFGKDRNISFDRTYIYDGSGLSGYNLVTPTLLVSVLNYAYHQPKIKDALIDALPHAGKDGTLKHRMKKLKDRIFAKTGTIENVSSLAGYIQTKRKNTIIFAIIINNPSGKSKKHQNLQNEICDVLARNY